MVNVGIKYVEIKTKSMHLNDKEIVHYWQLHGLHWLIYLFDFVHLSLAIFNLRVFDLVILKYLIIWKYISSTCSGLKRQYQWTAMSHSVPAAVQAAARVAPTLTSRIQTIIFILPCFAYFSHFFLILPLH